MGEQICMNFKPDCWKKHTQSIGHSDGMMRTADSLAAAGTQLKMARSPQRW